MLVSLGEDSTTGNSWGLGASMGVGGADSLASFARKASLFFSAVRKKTFMVVRRDLFGLQSSAERGECSQTGQDDGRFN